MFKPFRRASCASVSCFAATLALSAPVLAQTTITRADTDAHSLLYSISYTGTPAFRQIFLDTDQNTATGYRGSGLVGADYLIENDTLRQYTGSGTDWSWSQPLSTSVGFTTAAGPNGTTTASWTVLQSAVGSPRKIDLYANTHDPVSASPKMTQIVKSDVSITGLQGDASYLYYHVTFTGTPSFHRLYLDTDLNPATGFAYAGIGADYLIENGTFYSHSGSSTDWNWTPVNAVNVNFTSTGNTANWKVDSKSLGLPAQIDVIADVSYPAGNSPKARQRNPRIQPFGETSIWNRPMGTSAQFQDAKLGLEYGPGGNPNVDAYWTNMPQADLNRIVLTPTVTPSTPLTPVYPHVDDWSTTADWCTATGSNALITVPMPTSYVVSYPPDPNNGKGNSAAALLEQDGRTIAQTQPFARCTAGGYATSYTTVVPADLYVNAHGEDQYGAHGGSGMSSIGGSIRMGELRPNSIGPRHALAIEVDTSWVLAPCDTKTACWTWPADRSDGNATSLYGSSNPDAKNISSYMKMGALLAIPPAVNLDTLNPPLRTVPGRQLAWTLQNYGAYIVDGRGPGITFNVEEGADGSKRDEFKSDYGMDFEERIGYNNPWGQDVQELIGLLQVVTNNAPGTTASGGGQALQPPAPPLQPPQ